MKPCFSPIGVGRSTLRTDGQKFRLAQQDAAKEERVGKSTATKKRGPHGRQPIRPADHHQLEPGVGNG